MFDYEKLLEYSEVNQIILVVEMKQKKKTIEQQLLKTDFLFFI